MASSPVEALRRVPMLSGLSERETDRLAKELHERTFPEGSTVVAEGATGTGFFVIAEGNASVSVGGTIRTQLGPGDSFGEMALIDDAPRSATVVAVTDLRCYGMTPWEFRPFVETHPQVAWALLVNLSQRLRAAQADQHG
ncbi:MAG TPA: cyclic nucleotide-binding domain-containing protein [Gaiellaceae bacterium]|jgi:CRP/FNR family transcriptional regulator